MTNMKQIQEFAAKWLKKFSDENINYIDLVDHYLADDCEALDFEMDVGHAFGEKYGNAVSNVESLSAIIDQVTDIPLLGSAIYSQWRYFNHWAWSAEDILKPENRAWFITALTRMKELASPQPGSVPSKSPIIAEILCVGTELLMGQVLNTNAQFISRRLSALGVSQYHQTVVGDNAERLEEAYRLALSRADVVITSGGLGPTVDDITKRVAAKVAGKELVSFPEAEEAIRKRFQQYNRPMTQNNLSQAMFTPDSTLLPNHHGTAPGAIVPMGEGKVVIHLPGPPIELQPMWLTSVEPWIQARSGRVLVSKYIRIFGMGESEVDFRLSDLEMGGNPSLSPYCSLGEVQLRATASAATAEEAERLLEPLLVEVRARLGNVIYAIEDNDEGSLAKSCVEALKDRGWTVATAESLTGGMISANLVNISGASSVVRGGFVTYQTDTKTVLLDVPAETIEKYDVVSAQVAMGMAKGAREKLGVDIAISATGLAGPDGGTPERPVGTVYLGVSTANGTYPIRLRLTGNRDRIRTLAMKNAINAVRLEALGAK